LGTPVSERCEPAFGLAAFSPDGNTLWIRCQNGVLRQWSSAGHTLLRSLPAQPGWIESIAIPPAGDALAFTVGRRGIFLWDGSVRRLHADAPSSNVVFDAARGRLLAGTADGRLCWLDMDTGEWEAVDWPRG
jgi:WD40 repeat protein